MKSNSASPEFSVRDFFNKFSSDDACLDHVMEVRFGFKHECRKCGQMATFSRITKRKAYACSHCGDHVYPCAETVFQDTRTPLQLWFYAIFLFVTTRHGVRSKELQRQLGVTYKTAWRMGQRIREPTQRADAVEMLCGHVELDEAYVGGKRSGGKKRGRGAPGKTIVMGLKQRDGNMQTVVIPNMKKDTLRKIVNDCVEKGSVVSTDELMSYGLLTGDGFTHGSVKHGAKEWTVYDWRENVTHHTNNVESFWKLFKDSVRSTHIWVGEKHMPKYLAEFTFRSNNRHRGNWMFDRLIAAV